MPSQFNDYCGALTPVLPNGRALNTFVYRNVDEPLELQTSLELMGDEDAGNFLIGYQLGYLDHHSAVEIPNNPDTKSQLMRELQESGMEVNESDVRLYLHMDSDQFSHV